MPRSLGGRLIAAFVSLAIAILLAVGGTLFVALRGLHQDATFSTLSGAAGSVIPQVRDSIGKGDLRGAILDVRTQLAALSIEVMIVGADGRLKPLDGTPPGTATIETDPAVGGTTRGSVTIGTQRYLYVATTVRRLGAAAPRAIAFLQVDRSGALALADVGRTIPIVVLAILLIGAPLALVLSRSVTRPLERLATAAMTIPAGTAASLPLEGPKEVRELTGTFNAMTAELDDTRRRERELLANLRHDLRTPLTVITGFAAALADGTATGDAAAAAATAIEEEAARLERLVAEVGAVERIGSGEESIRPEMLDSRLLIAETVARFRARAAAAGVDLAPADPAATEPLALAADRLALERMLGNLVENAIVAAQGIVRIEAAIERSSDAPDAIRIDVLDDGPGFPDGTAAKAFERFWRGDPSRSGVGSGLGLAIVRELALAHGGSAHATNRPEGGARVGVTLPRLPTSKR